MRRAEWATASNSFWLGDAEPMRKLAWREIWSVYEEQADLIKLPRSTKGLLRSYMQTTINAGYVSNLCIGGREFPCVIEREPKQ